MRLNPKEPDKIISERIDTICNSPEKLSTEDVSLLKETFGKDFLTSKYYINKFKIMK
jgi:hypothetical protein